MFSRKGTKEIKDKEEQDIEMKERRKPNNESFFSYFLKFWKGEALVRVNSRRRHLPGILSQSFHHTSLQKVPGSQSIQPSSRKK